MDEIVEGDSAAVFDAAMNKALKLSHLPRSGVYGLIKVSHAMYLHFLFTDFCVERGQRPGDNGDERGSANGAHSRRGSGVPGQTAR